MKRGKTHNYEKEQNRSGNAVVYSKNEFDMVEATTSKRLTGKDNENAVFHPNNVQINRSELQPVSRELKYSNRVSEIGKES